MKVAISSAGRFWAFHLAHQLNKAGYLEKIYTTAYGSEDKSYVPEVYVKNNCLLRYLDVVYYKFRISKFIPASPWYVFKDKLFDNWVKKQLSNLDEIDIFVGWANYFLGCLPLIKKTGAKIVLESGSTHISYMSKVLEEEYCRYGVTYSPICSANRDKILQEYDAADYIMTPSQFVYDSFIQEGISAKKVLKVPFGVDINKFYLNREKPSKKFQVIFTGLVGLRKGVIYLLEAWSRLKLKNAELLIIGNFETNFYSVLNKLKVPENVIFMGPVSHVNLREIYKEASVFVLPSIEEGLALVQLEAMSSGLPIIHTINTGGGEIIEDGEEGFVIPVRDVNALSDKILWCYQNRDACFDMGKKAQKKIENFSWDSYGQKVINCYEHIVGNL